VLGAVRASQSDLTEDEVLGRSNDMFYRMLIGC